MNALNIALKDIRIFLTDRSAMIQLLLLPLLFIIIFSGALGEIGKSQEEEDTRIPLTVVNLDGGELAQALLARVDAAGGVRTEIAAEEEANAWLSEKKIERLLMIPADFTASLQAGKQTTLRLVSHPDADPGQTEAARLVVTGVANDISLGIQILASLEQMGAMMVNSPPEYQRAFSVEKVQDQARAQSENSLAKPLIQVDQKTPLTEEKEDEAQGLTSSMLAVPGCAVLFVFLSAQATASSIYEEKKSGSFRRLLASPVSKSSLLVGKLLPNFLTGLFQVTVIFAFGSVGMRILGMQPVDLGNDWLALVLAVILLTLCSSALGIVIAALARTESQVSGISTLLMWILGALGGSIIPTFFLDQYLGPLVYVVPHYWANRVLDNLMIRGLGLADVSTELLALLGFTVVFFAFGLWRFDFD